MSFSNIFNRKPSQSVQFIVAGLGNPEDKYTYTRHNAGFLAMDYISQKLSVNIKKIKYHSLCEKCDINGVGVLLMKPQTYMNNSGIAIKEAADFYKIPAENIIIICDDISLPVAKIRIRRNGSDGGHNGLKSIISHIGGNNFPRVKIGVGEKPHPDYDLADWVLGKFTKDEQKLIFDDFERVYDSVMKIINGETEKAMQLYN